MIAVPHETTRPARARRHDPQRGQNSEGAIGAADLGPFDILGAPARRRPPEPDQSPTCLALKNSASFSATGGLTEEIVQPMVCRLETVRLRPRLVPGRTDRELLQPVPQADPVRLTRAHLSRLFPRSATK